MDTLVFRTSKRRIEVPWEKAIELQDRLVNLPGGAGVIEAISHRTPAGVVLTHAQKKIVYGVLNDWGALGTIADLGDELMALRDELDDDLHP